MTQRTNYQRSFDSSQQINRQIQSSQQRFQDRVQSSYKRMQEINQSQRNSNYAYSGYTPDVFSYRFSVWCVIQSLGTSLIMPIALITLPRRVAVKALLSLLGCFTVTNAIGCYCYDDSSPKLSLDEFGRIILPEFEDKSKKLPAEGYYDAIRSLLSRVTCYCSSWFISQGKPPSKLHL